MANKVTVNLSSKLIIVNNGITSLDAEVDLYSDLKEDWVANANGELGFEFPFRTVGGDTLPGGLEAGAFFFLRNDLGWRIRPYEGDHELIITGNLYPESIAYPMTVPTLGGYTVSIPWERSSLTQQTAPQDADIDAIKAKTDNLPANPADEATTQTIKIKTDNLPTDPADQSLIENRIATAAQALEAISQTIKNKTDGIPADPAIQSLIEARIAEAFNEIKGTPWTDETLKLITKKIEDLELQPYPSRAHVRL